MSNKLRLFTCTAALLSSLVPVTALAIGAGIGSYQCRHVAPKFYGDDAIVYNHLYEWISGYGHAFSDTREIDFGHTESMHLMINVMEACQDAPNETVQSIAFKLLKTSSKSVE